MQHQQKLKSYGFISPKRRVLQQEYNRLFERQDGNLERLRIQAQDVYVRKQQIKNIALQYTQKNATINQLQKCLKDTKSQQIDNIDSNERKQREFVQLSTKYENLKIKNDANQAKIRELENSINQYASELNRFRQDKDRQRIQQSELQNENDHIKKEIKNIEGRYEAITTKLNNQLKRKIEEIKEVSEENQSLKMRLGKANEKNEIKINDLKQELNKKDTVIKNHEKVEIQMQKYLSEIKLELQNTQRKSASELNRIKEQLSDMKEQNIKLNKKQVQKQKLEHDYKHIQTLYQNLQQSSKADRIRLKQFAKQANYNSKKEEQYRQLVDENKLLHQKIRQLSRRYETKHSNEAEEIKRLKNKLSELEKEIYDSKIHESKGAKYKELEESVEKKSMQFLDNEQGRKFKQIIKRTSQTKIPTKQIPTIQRIYKQVERML